jgi:hypothetical protein
MQELCFGLQALPKTQLLTRFARHIPQQSLVVYGLAGMGVAVLITAVFGTMGSTAAGMLGLGFCAAAIFITATSLTKPHSGIRPALKAAPPPANTVLSVERM